MLIRDPVGSIPGMRDLWRMSIGSPRISVAIIDGAANLAHESLLGAALESSDSSFPEPPTSIHGTHVTSLIFGGHQSGVRGVAPGCRGVVIPLYRELGNGELAACSQLDLARAIATATQRRVNIINISGGELTASGEAQHFLADAVRKAAESGSLVIAAAGNDGCDCLHVPAALPSVLAVGAADDSGQPLSSSNWARSLAGHGVLAPGYRIPGAATGGGVFEMTGTSAAAPIVSGVAALLMDLQIQRNGAFDARAVFDAIVTSAIPCVEEPPDQCIRMLAGTLNIPGAFQILFGEPLPAATDIGEIPLLMQPSATAIAPGHHGDIRRTTGFPSFVPIRRIFQMTNQSVDRRGIFTRLGLGSAPNS